MSISCEFPDEMAPVIIGKATKIKNFKEDIKMADMVKLNDDALDSVSGGAFNYYKDSSGQNKCMVDDVGKFYCTPDAFGYVAAYASDVSLTAQQVVDWALANGYFSYSPF